MDCEYVPERRTTCGLEVEEGRVSDGTGGGGGESEGDDDSGDKETAAVDAPPAS